MLDIIIPTYKNLEGLICTLNSIDWSLPELEVTVVDDCSHLQYDKIQEQFPLVKNWLYLPANVGPGMARQRGIEFTTNPYIMFIDTGDYFLSKESQQEIVSMIKKEPNYYLYFWHFTDGKTYSTSTNNHLHGKVYNRNFIQTYGISFSKQGSYANEDIGFNRQCRLILQHLELLHNHKFAKEIKKNVIMWSRADLNSLTLKDNGAFSYSKQNYGLAYNMMHAYEVLKNTSVPKNIIAEDASDVINHMYFAVICAAAERPEFLPQAWGGAKLFYENIYKNITISNDILQMRCSQLVKWVFKHFSKPPLPINLRRFLIDLATNDTPPANYII